MSVTHLLRATPGPDVLTALAAINPFSLDAADRIDYLSAVERQAAWVNALMQRAIVAVAGEEPAVADPATHWQGVDDAPREDVSSALRLSGMSAQRRIDTARSLYSSLPTTRAALESGEISPEHAMVISQEMQHLIRSGVDAAIVEEVEQAAVAHAEFHTPGQVGRKVRDAVARHASESVEVATTAAYQTRRVTLYPENDGMATIVALLPAPDAQILLKTIDAIAHSADGDERTIDQRRADALIWLAVNAPINHESHGRPVAINVTVDIATLFGLADNPGELEGYGPIPAGVARALAADGQWRRLVTDPVEGHLLDLGRRSYRPSQQLSDYLIARDRTCRFPGCNQPRVDIDHAIPWDSGGETVPENLGLLCRRHHRLKTHGGWSVESKSDGSCLWRSPTGHTYFVPARPVLGGMNFSGAAASLPQPHPKAINHQEAVTHQRVS